MSLCVERTGALFWAFVAVFLAGMSILSGGPIASDGHLSGIIRRPEALRRLFLEVCDQNEAAGQMGWICFRPAGIGRGLPPLKRNSSRWNGSLNQTPSLPIALAHHRQGGTAALQPACFRPPESLLAALSFMRLLLLERMPQDYRLFAVRAC